MKRSFTLLSAVFVLLSLLTVVQPPRAQAAGGVVRVLAIGHSYSNNATEFIDEIAESMGVGDRIEVYSLYYQGCSLNQHVNFYNKNEAVYELYRGGRNVFGAGKLITMKEAFAYERYDYVTLQQQPGQSAFFSTYEPALGQLAAIVRREEPQAKLQMHQTWGPCNHCAVHGDRYSVDTFGSSAEVFEATKDSYAQAAQKIGAAGIVPAGEAVQLAKAYGYGDFHNPNAAGDVLQCQNGALYADDIHHLNQRGRYLAACVWIEHFLGKDTRTATYVAPVLDEEDCEKLRQIAHEAVTGEKGPLPEASTPGQTSTSTTATSTTATVTTTAGAVSTTADTETVIVPPSVNVGLLIGLVAGGVIVLAGIVVAIVLLVKKK